MFSADAFWNKCDKKEKLWFMVILAKMLAKSSDTDTLYVWTNNYTRKRNILAKVLIDESSVAAYVVIQSINIQRNCSQRLFTLFVSDHDNANSRKLRNVVHQDHPGESIVNITNGQHCLVLTSNGVDVFTIRHRTISQTKRIGYYDNVLLLFNFFTAEFHKVNSFMLKIGPLHFSFNRKFGKFNV